MFCQVYLLGLVDAIVDSFGAEGGNFAEYLPETGHWKSLYGSCLLLLMLFVVLIGAEVKNLNFLKNSSFQLSNEM